MRGEADHEIIDPFEDIKNDEEQLNESSGDSYSASFSNPPSSFADDSWLVLPIDSPPDQPGAGFSNGPMLSDMDHGDEIFDVPPKTPKSLKSDEEPKRRPLFKSSKQADNNGVLNAFNRINSSPTDPKDDAAKIPAESTGSRTSRTPSEVNVPPPQATNSESLSNSVSSDNKSDFSLFNRKDKTDQTGATRERKLFDSKRKGSKDQRTEVKLPEIHRTSSNGPGVNLDTSSTTEEKQSDVNPPEEYRTEVVLPGLPKKNVKKPEEADHSEPLPGIVEPESDRTMLMDFEDEAVPPDEEVSLSDLLLKLRNDSDIRGSETDGIAPPPESRPPKEQEESQDESLLESLIQGTPAVPKIAPVETVSFSVDEDREVTEPLVDPLEALAKPKKPATKEQIFGSEVPSTSSLLDTPENDSLIDKSKPDSSEQIMPPSVLTKNGMQAFDSEKEDTDSEDIGNVYYADETKPNSVIESDSEIEPVDDHAQVDEMMQYHDDVQHQSTDEAVPPQIETMAQRRARYIEEERKKLYSLIGRLEQSTGDVAPVIEQRVPVEEEEARQPLAHSEYLSEPEPVEAPEPEDGEKDEIDQVTRSSDRAISLMDYIDAVPDGEVQEPGLQVPLQEEDVASTMRSSNLVDEVTDNLQQADAKNITASTSNPVETEDLDSHTSIPDEEILFSKGTPPASRPVIPTNEEEVVMPESQKDEQVPTVEVQEIVEHSEEKIPSPIEENTAQSEPEEPDQRPSMEFDQLGFTFENLVSVVECLAFAAEEPIPLKKVARIYSEVQGTKMPTEDDVLAVVDQLNEAYEKEGRSFRIKSWGRGIRMATHPQFANYIRALYQDNKPKKLSRTLMETLSIIAYSQPTTKPEVDFVRGVDSDYAVRKLLELGLIDIVGRSDAIGRPLLYGTSERFLDQFGLSEIEALPKLREVEELLGDPAFQKERLHLLALEGLDTQEKEPEADQKTNNNGSEPTSGEEAA